MFVGLVTIRASRPRPVSLARTFRCRADRMSEPGNPITNAVRVVAGRLHPARPVAPPQYVRPPTGHPRLALVTPASDPPPFAGTPPAAFADESLRACLPQ